MLRGTIGRANLDGTGVDQSFISGAGAARDVAVDAGHVYWTDFDAQTIGRANLDGSGIDRSFISGAGAVDDLVVDALTVDTVASGRVSAAQTQRQHGKKIVVKVKVKAKEQLTAKASGKVKVNPTYKLKPKKAQVAAGETKTLKLKPKKKGQAKRIAAALKRGKKATAKLTVKLTDLAGNSETEKLRVKLKR